MKYISLKWQRYMLFIPMVNWCIFFIAYYNSFKVPNLTIGQIIKGIFAAIVAILCISILCDNYINISILSNILRFYISAVIVGEIFIVIQKKRGIN